MKSPLAQRGFTIVELLIVIVVIGILAAITIVAFNGVQSRASGAALKSDLSNAQTQLGLDYTNNQVYPDSKESANSGKGLSTSSGTSLEYSLVNGQYCMTVSSTRTTAVYSVSSTTNTVADGACPGQGGAVISHGVTTFVGSGVSSNVDGTGTGAGLSYPMDIAVAPSGDFYLADTNLNNIRKVTAAGVVTTIAGSGPGQCIFANGTGAAAAFCTPDGIAVDSSGMVYISDFSNNRIRKMTPAGVVTTLAGSGTAGFVNGTGTAAQFVGPRGLAVDIVGNVYVTDYSSNRIRKITPAGVVTTFVGSGVNSSLDGTGTSATFSSPYGVAVDGSDNLYVTEFGGSRIRKVTPTGVVTTLAGSVSGYADGPGATAQFYFPRGITVDSQGFVYVSEQTSSRIRKISPTGYVSTLAGTGPYTGAPGYADGIGSAAKFDTPIGLAIGKDNTLLIVDQYNNRIRQIK